MRILTILLFAFSSAFLAPNLLRAEDSKVLDSLYQELDLQRSPEQRSQTYLQLGKAYYKEALLDSAALYFHQSACLAKENYLDSMTALSHRLLLRTQYESERPFRELFDLADSTEAIAKRAEDMLTLLQTELIKGAMYKNIHQIDKALKCFNKSLEYLDQVDEKSNAVPIYNEMANLYAGLKDWRKSSMYYEKALKIAEEYDWQLGKSVVLNNLGDNYLKEQEYQKAEDYFKQSIAIKKRLGNKTNLSVSLCQIAELYLETDRWDLAAQSASEGLELAINHEYYNGMVICYNAISEVQNKQNDQYQRINYAEEGLNLALQKKEASNEFLQYFYKHLYEAYSANEDYERAYSNLQKYSALKDSIESLKNSSKINELEVSFELKEAQMLNDILEEQKKQAQLKLEQRQILLFAVCLVFFLGLIGVLAWIAQKNRLNQALDQKVKEKTAALEETIKELERANEELNQFTYITSHDLKEPLRSINGFTTLLERELGGNIKEEAKDLMHNIKRYVNQMHKLIEGVIQYSLISNQKPAFEAFSLHGLLIEVQSNLNGTVQNSKAEIYLNQDMTLYSSKSHLSIILSNLLKNAIYYNERTIPEVQIEANSTSTGWIINVSDNGIGIEKEYLEKIFVMFKRLHSRMEYEGTGLGLAITKRLIEQLGGTIAVESIPGSGSEFSIFLPKAPVKRV